MHCQAAYVPIGGLTAGPQPRPGLKLKRNHGVLLETPQGALAVSGPHFENQWYTVEDSIWYGIISKVISLDMEHVFKIWSSKSNANTQTVHIISIAFKICV